MQNVIRRHKVCPDSDTTGEAKKVFIYLKQYMFSVFQSLSCVDEFLAPTQSGFTQR